MRRKARPNPHTFYSPQWPRKSRCALCRKDILVGDYNAIRTAYDIECLSQKGELAALLLGLKTFHFVEPHVYPRNVRAIQAAPRVKFGTVHREHRCNLTGVDFLVDSTATELPDQCPF